MTGALLDSGQAGVGQAQQRPVRRLFDQVDLDQARPRRHGLAAVPTEAVSQAMHRHHFTEGAPGEASPGNIDEIKSARLHKSTLRVNRPMLVVVLKDWVTETKETPWASNVSTSLAKSASDRVSRSTL